MPHLRSVSPPTGLLQLGLVDEVIPEPLGGAHKDPEKVATRVGNCLAAQLEELDKLTTESLLKSVINACSPTANSRINQQASRQMSNRALVFTAERLLQILRSLPG